MKTLGKKNKIRAYLMGNLGTLALIALFVCALVAIPYGFHKGPSSMGKSLVYADDGDSGGDDGDSGGDAGIGGDDGDSDGDAGISGDDGDSGISGDDGDVGDDSGDDVDHDSAAEVDDNDDAGHEAEAGDDASPAGDNDSSHDGNSSITDIGGLQDLSVVSSEDEAGLLGNWGDAETKP